MDEPLSNLDAKLRVEMRTVIKEIQNRVGITTVYVTHDQEEAMAVSDRIAVMKDGDIQHIGTPKDLYQRPANLFVSTFIGRTNVTQADLVVEEDKTYVLFADGYKLYMDNVLDQYKESQRITVSIRPEELLISTDDSAGMKAVIDDSIFLGLNTHYMVHLEDGTRMEIIQESKIDSIIPKGSTVNLTINAEKVNLFTEDGSKNILTGVKNDGEQYRKG